MSSHGRRLQDEGSRLQVVSAGATAGLVSRFIIAPFDVVKIRLQLQPRSSTGPVTPLPATWGTIATIRDIFRHDGIPGFWKGNIPAECLYVCYAAAQFTAYRSMTVFLKATLPTGVPDAAESFIAGASAGAAATTVTYPLDLLRTRFAAQGRQRIYSSLRGAIRDIRRDEGLKGFFRGLTPGLMQIVPYMGIFFATYEGLRVSLSGLNMPWGSADATAGVIGSVIAKTAIFPLDLVRKRIQVQGPTRGRYVFNNIPEYTSALKAIVTIVQTDGFRGLYRGLPVSLAKAAPAGAITLWTYEQCLAILIRHSAELDTVP